MINIYNTIKMNLILSNSVLLENPKNKNYFKDSVIISIISRSDFWWQ